MNINEAREEIMDWLTPDIIELLGLISNKAEFDDNCELDNITINSKYFNWYEIGTTKFVFTIPGVRDWVFKIPLKSGILSDYAKDHCLIEVNNYQHAVDDGVEEFFAETASLGEIINSSNGSVDLYASPNLEWDGWDDPGDEGCYPKEIYEAAEELFRTYRQGRIFPWDGISPIEHLIEAKISREKTLQLLDFLVKYEIQDNHEGNYKFTEDGLVFIDYSI